MAEDSVTPASPAKKKRSENEAEILFKYFTKKSYDIAKINQIATMVAHIQQSKKVTVFTALNSVVLTHLKGNEMGQLTLANALKVGLEGHDANRRARFS